MGMTTALAPEIWNLTVIVTVCALMGWVARIVRVLFAFAELRHAASLNAVLYLKDLGMSLGVLQGASTWHLQQLVRTNSEDKASTMSRVVVVFDLVTSSIDINKRAHDVNADPARGTGASPCSLSFTVRSASPVAVQVFWNVRCEALEASVAAVSTASASSKSGEGDTRVRILRSLSMAATARALRSAPTRLSRVRRQRRRHELSDETTSEESILSPNDSLLQPADCACVSDVYRVNQLMTLTVPIPGVVLNGQSLELQSLIEEVDSHEPAAPARPSRSASEPPVAAPRYSAVIIMRALSSEPSGSQRLDRRRASSSVAATTVKSVLVAVDFLPTPLKPERYSPAVVKKVCYTDSDAYISQEIYGNDDSSSTECAICLEGTSTVVLLPCRHMCVCKVCLEEIDRCPICRTKFTTYVSLDGGVERDDL